MENIFPSLGGVNSIHIIDRSNTDRVLKIILYGTNRNKIISGKNLRKKLKLLSTKFEFDLKFSPFNSNKVDNKLNYENKLVNDLAPQPLPLIPEEYFLFVRGFGAGHGVGMSQWGAKKMAERGSSFSKILKHYYTCLLYTSPSPRDQRGSRMPSSA